MEKQEFLNIGIKNISQVYSGKRDCCRCGCGGDYISTSYAINQRSDINDALVLKRLNRAKKLLQNGADYDADSSYFEL